jgi:hypothetical protein
MGVWSRFEDIDVQHCPARRVGVQGTQIIYDHGPLPPSEQSRAAMRRYHAEHEEWLRSTGGKPYRVALNSIDAQSWLAADRRYSRSATERAPVQVQPQATGQVINLVAASGVQLGGFWLLDLVSGNKYVVFSPDYIEWQSRDLRYQPTSPSA